MDSAMDIDLNPSSLFPTESTQGTSTRKRSPSPLSESSHKRARFDPARSQLIKINKEMAPTTESWKVTLKPETEEKIWRAASKAILFNLVKELRAANVRSTIIDPNQERINANVEELTGDEWKQWKTELWTALKKGDWQDLFDHPLIQKPIVDLYKEHDAHLKMELSKAYNINYVGHAVTYFVEQLREHGEGPKLYAKVISIVQSSGTGKSRLLTEAGRIVFTLPICLREEGGVGYPVGDWKVLQWFDSLNYTDDLSLSAHDHISSFLAAAHQTMLEHLQRWRSDGGLSGEELLDKWHKKMELDEPRDFRNGFFAQVLEKADKVFKEMNRKSGARNATTQLVLDPMYHAKDSYNQDAHPATTQLMKFISECFPDQSPICITYFDEAHYLGESMWIMARFLSVHDHSLLMWYVFMSTKADISCFAPRPRDQRSPRLQNEISRLPRPYIALGFDQHIRAQRFPAHFDELQSIEHVSKYGRPLWKALCQTIGPDGMIGHAKMKLVCGEQHMNAQNAHHVFAVLSQRLCIEPVMAYSEGVTLAKTSVSNHMRLLTAFSPKMEVLSTYSPSEPILALGAAHLLYDKANQWEQVLETFTQSMCNAGLVEKGLVGELAARTLLVIARDFATPTISGTSIPDLLQPVLLSTVIDTLLNQDVWAHERIQFMEGFKNAYVNYTHWMVTKDPLPNAPSRKLLANLWARGVALQCSFHQVSLDCLIPIYFGSVDSTTEFNPQLLSAMVVQVKNRVTGDAKAEAALSPIGVPRAVTTPLPYLALVLELGLPEKKAAITTTVPAVAGVPFETLVASHISTVSALYQEKEKGCSDQELKRLTENVKKSRLKRDAYNRYSLSVQGASANIYNILELAGIKDVFKTFLQATMAPPASPESLMEQMLPGERFGPVTEYTTWMMDIEGDEVQDIEEDSMV